MTDNASEKILVKRPFTLYYAKLGGDHIRWDHSPAYRASVIKISQIITGI